MQDLAEAGLSDIVEGIKHWRISHLIGIAELRRRYARSRLGQFWLAISTGMQIGALGLVWSLLWKTPVSEMMPYFAVSLIVWYMISGLITDATTVFATYGTYFINQRMSFATAIYALLYRNVLILLHNAVIVIVVFAIFLKPVGIRSLLALPGLCLAILTGFWLSYVVAILCARYRDLSQLVSNIVQVAFYLTPVLWKVEFIPPNYRYLLPLNPFAIYLSIIRDPILDKPIPLEFWVIALSITIGGFLLALPFIGLYHKRIIYWL